MDAHLPNVCINQCSTQKTRDIKWTHISVMSSLIFALPRKPVILNGRTFACLRCTPKTRDIKWTHICRMSALINALPRKLVILNGRTFPLCLV